MARAVKRQAGEGRIAKVSIFLSAHWKEAVSVMTGIVVVIGTIFLYYSYATGRNERAARSFIEAKALFDEAESQMESEEQAESVIDKYESARTKFQKISQGSGHRDTISRALFYSGKCSYRLGRYTEAISAFQKFVSKYPKNEIALDVRKALAQCYEQLGEAENLRKAIQQYDELLRYPETYVTLEAYIDKGRCYEKLGELDKDNEEWYRQAITTYKLIVDKFKQKLELAVQSKSRVLVQKARDVISKYETALGKGMDPDFARSVDEADALTERGQWIEALQMYDRAIFSQKAHWAEEAAKGYSRAFQNASDALRDYEDSSTSVIKNIRIAQQYQDQGDMDTALRYYRGVTEFDFLPGPDLFEKAQFRIYWINSMERSVTSDQ